MKPFRQEFEIRQPLAYRILENALGQKRSSHAYLFTGKGGEDKKRAAFLLVKSLLCEKADPFACEECALCERVEHKQYADFVYRDIREEKTGVEDIRSILSDMQKTAMEEYGRRMLVLDHSELLNDNCTNALLKFLEEPAENTTIVLITDELDHILPTVRSRCQIVPFQALSVQDLEEACRKEEAEADDIWLVSRICSDAEECLAVLKDPLFADAKEVFYNFVVNLSRGWDDALVKLENDEAIRKGKTLAANKNLKEVLRYFTDLLLLFFATFHEEEKNMPEAMKNARRKLQGSIKDTAALQEILLDSQSLLYGRIAFNTGLVLDRMVYRMKEAQNERR